MSRERRRQVSLEGGGWRVGSVSPGGGLADVAKWHPATVPGNIQNDLFAAGVVPDPYFGMQNEASRWIEKYDWWYCRDFKADPSDGRRTMLIFKGIDYRCDIFLNGRRIASHTGMFSPITIDITRRVDTENALCVRIENTASIKDRVKTMKCQMGFGWDFAPAIRTMGIWDHALIARPMDAFIKNIAVDPALGEDGGWMAPALVEIDSAVECEAEIEYIIEGANFNLEKPIKQKQLVLLHKGMNNICAEIPISDAKLWEPWEEGKQNLYSLSIVIRRDKKTLDADETRFGLRTVKLLANDGRPDHLWTFEINGKRKFIRGANWVPADSMPGRVDAARYRALLEKAREANINMLRVWGGGLREKQEFYDIADELGILIWQDFPFACPQGPYPRSERYFQLARREARAVVRSCRNHPSVAMFCGGNEFSRTLNKKLVDELHRIVDEYGGGRPYKETSPTLGERHSYIVHHSLGNVAEYLEEDCSFFSEFGMQSAPCRESVEKFIPEENFWPVKPALPYSLAELSLMRPEEFEPIGRFLPKTRTLENSRMWAYHSAQLAKVVRYAKQVGYENLDSFIEATQRMQAHGMQLAIENMRRRKYASSGVMFWQFNEPWPAISWAVLDYYLVSKRSFHKVRESYSPLVALLQYEIKKYNPGDSLEARVFVVNDLHKKFKNLKLAIRVTAGGAALDEKEIKLPEIEPDSIIELDPVVIDIPAGKSPEAECVIADKAGKAISRNAYDLEIFDAQPTMPLFKFAYKTMERLMWS